MTCTWLDDDASLAASADDVDAHLAACEHCSRRLDDYNRIATRIRRSAASHRSPSGWAQRTLARVHADQRARRARRRHVAVVSMLSGAVAAAAVVLVLWPPHRGATQIAMAPPHRVADTPANVSDASRGLAVEIIPHGGHRGATPDEQAVRVVVTRLAPSRTLQAYPGDELRAEAVLSVEPYFAIRVYRGHTLVAACPAVDNAMCSGPRRSVLTWKLPGIGTYQLLLLVSRQPIATSRGSLGDDVAAETHDGARVLALEVIDVR